MSPLSAFVCMCATNKTKPISKVSIARYVCLRPGPDLLFVGSAVLCQLPAQTRSPLSHMRKSKEEKTTMTENKTKKERKEGMRKDCLLTTFCFPTWSCPFFFFFFLPQHPELSASFPPVSHNRPSSSSDPPCWLWDVSAARRYDKFLRMHTQFSTVWREKRKDRKKEGESRERSVEKKRDKTRRRDRWQSGEQTH